MREAIISFPMFGEGFSINPPASFEIGNFSIYFYGVIIAVGFLLALLYVTRICGTLDITADDIYDYLIWGVILAVIFARIYYCLTYVDSTGAHPYLQDPKSFLDIRGGGLAIYGGVIGAIIAVLIRSRMKRQSVFPIFDVMAFGLLIGQLIGRWGNFMNREAFGYETDIFCRMGLTLNGSTIYVHPTFLYESLWNLIGFILLHFHRKHRRKYQGQYFILYIFWYGLGRMFIEGLRTDSLWLIPDVIRVSQLLAAVTMVLAAVVYLINARRLKQGRKPLFGKLPAQPAADGEAEPDPETDAAAEQETVPEETSLPDPEDQPEPEPNESPADEPEVPASDEE